MSSSGNNKPSRKPFTAHLSSTSSALSSSERASLKHESSANAVMQVVRQSLSTDRPSSAGLMSLQRELEFAKAELEREQTQRKLDRQKADQESARLRRQMEFLLEELDGHKSESEKIRLQAEKDVQSLKHRLEDTIDSLRTLEEENDSLQQMEHRHEQQMVGTAQDQRWNDRCEVYEEEVSKLRNAFRISEQRATEAERKLFQCEQKMALRRKADVDSDEEIENMKAEQSSVTPEGKAALASLISTRQQLNREPTTVDGYMDAYLSPSKRKRRKVFGEVSSSPSSPAPPVLMRELTKVRLSLADAERSNRMLTRKYEESKNKLHELSQVNERYERLKERTTFLESQYSSALKKLMTMEEVEKMWIFFRKELLCIFEQKEIFSDTRKEISSLVPPEINTVLRKFQSLTKQMKDKDEECESYRSQLESSNRRTSSLQDNVDSHSLSLSQMKEQIESERKKLDLLQMEVDRAQGSERIAKSEAKSMQQLLETYELREVAGVKDGTLKISGMGSSEGNMAGPGIVGLRTSLSLAHEENHMLKEAHKAVSKKLQALQECLDEKLMEHNRVLEKFNKLRSSLMDEREKARKAEERAIHAESLAGKGSFDQGKTRALHLKENPLMKAVRDKYESQMAALQGAIERHKKESDHSPQSIGCSASSTTPAASSTSLEGLEAKKLNQRLKDSFQEHIGVFREAVYLLTGYKVDMIMDSDSPRFKVRSMYAERQEDHLMFVWPKVDRGAKELKPTRLDLLDTDLAKSLSATPTFEYLSKYDSLPAFSAALTLALFENTTFAG